MMSASTLRTGISRSVPLSRFGEIRVSRRRMISTPMISSPWTQALTNITGPGLAPGVVDGVGLANTRERLRELYGEKHRFELANHPEGGLEVRINLPV